MVDIAAAPTRASAESRAPQATTVRREAFLAIEDSLAIPTFNSWKREASSVVQKIADRFQAGDINGAFAAVEELDLGPVARRQKRRARFTGEMAVIFGATDFARARNTRFAKEQVPEVVDRAVEIFQMTLIDTNEVVRREARVFLQQKLDEKEGRVPMQKLVGSFAVDLGKRAIDAGGQNILLASSLHASRLGSWGFTQEATARNVQFYRVSEQLDIRTCPVCREMNGKVFSVAGAADKLNRWLSVDNPNDMKTIATWPSQSRAGIRNLKAMNTEQLSGAGWDTPPYHPFCRGVLRKSRKPPTVGAPGALEPGVAPRVRPGRSALPLDQYAKQFDDPNITAGAILDDLSPSVRREVIENDINLRRLRATDTVHKVDGAWTTERLAVHDSILGDIFTTDAVAAATPEAGVAPRFTMLGGRGGSGKASLEGRVFDPKTNIVLDPDKIKLGLPEFRGWNAAQVHQEASFIFARAHRIARDLRLNVVSDATMRDLAKVQGLLKDFKKSGYSIEGHYMFLPRQDAALRAVTRFLASGPRKRGRYVPVEVVLNNVDNDANFQALKSFFGRWSIWDNQVPKGRSPLFVGGKGVSFP